MDEAGIEDIDMVEANEPYPKGNMTSDDGVFTVPFNLLAGEGGRYRGRTSEGILIATNYRLFHSEGTFFNIPLGVIDYVECRDIFYLYIYSKDGRTFRCIFDNNEYAQTWLKRIQTVSKTPEKTEDHFGFGFFLWTMEQQKGVVISHALCDLKHSPALDMIAEAERMGFNLQDVWKISQVNENYELCPSYPKSIIVPISITDQNLKDLAYFRYSKRIPAVVWRNKQNGCVIARSSQPKMGLWGLWGWRDKDDEKLIQAILDACLIDHEETNVNGKEEELYSLKSDLESDLSIYCEHGEQQNKRACKKLLIVDARSYAAAMTNRAKGGGYENNVYYPNCEMQFMGLANIHTIRNSFSGVRFLCASPDDPNWLSSLENTKWLHHISGIIRAALIVVNAVDVEKRPVLVHCSDGWDRTPQIVALAELMLDPYYRTKKGFQILIEKEWLEFGHKFADRCGHSNGIDDRNERCPVFLQWLDCVHQLLMQFECKFEFNLQYLARLAVHAYSNLFGNFFFNNDQSRWEYRVSQRTFSIWPLLNEKSQFHNYLYEHSNEVLRPSFQIRCLKFWNDVYLADNCTDPGSISNLEENVEKTNLVKTKSCDNINAPEHPQNLIKHNSNPDLAENSFSNNLNYTQIPDFIEDGIPVACNSTPENFLASNKECENKDYNETINGSERTGICSNGILYPTLFLKDKPTIDGSTDTLVSELGGVVQGQSQAKSIVDNVSSSLTNIKPACSVSTSTTDLPLTIENVLQTGIQNITIPDFRLTNWSQNMLQAYITNKRNSNASNSCSCSYTTPNHSRTPSSGFPATPCDDPCEMSTLRNPAVLDIDGLNIIPMSVQERVKKIILHYKKKVADLQCELSDALDLCRYFVGKDNHCADVDDAPSLPDSACSGEQHADSRGSESSWDFLSTGDSAVSNFIT